MAFAAFITVIAVFENIISFSIDLKGMSRRKSALMNCVLLSLPCALGFNLFSGFQPMGEGTGVLDLLDFIVSNNILPLGSLVYLFFCVSRRGWGWKNFLAEANEGKGKAIEVPEEEHNGYEDGNKELKIRFGTGRERFFGGIDALLSRIFG